MGCCPGAFTPVSAGIGDGKNDIRENSPMRGETAECYMANATNPTGKQDDATDYVPNKIQTSQIPLDADGKVNVTFKMTQITPVPEGLRTPTAWGMKMADGSGAWSHSAVSFSGSTGTFSGTFKPEDFGKTFSVTVSAIDAEGEIDNRGYTFSPAKSNGTDSIQLIQPLPGGICNSPFSLNRKHPITGIVKPHNGCDFKMADRSVKDVVAACDGEVVFTGFQEGGAGNYIKIKHNNGVGKHLCTTVYMHLAKIYVQNGQKVSANQKIGLEGSTGGSTGNHLHFECRLPNGVAIDPLPLIRGSLNVANETTPENDPKPGTIETVNNNNVLTPSNVDAKQSCAPYGPKYPNEETAEAPVPDAPLADAEKVFELAWALTMQTECLIWPSTPPTVQSTIDGLISTKSYQQRVGYINDPSDSGGETKYGIAQKFNRSTNVNSIAYKEARDIGFAKYWTGKKSSELANTKPRTGIAVFNLGYLMGESGVSRALSAANINGKSDSESLNALCDAAKAYFKNNAESNPKNSKFLSGWLSRCERVRSYCNSVNIPEA